MTNIKKVLSVFLLSGLLSGCLMNSNASEVDYKEHRYQADPIELKVSKLEVISEFSPSFQRPNVEHLLPTSIEKTARIWARDNLEAVESQSDKTAYFIVKDASVVESEEPYAGAFQKNRTKYRANLNIILKITDAKELSRAQTEIQAWRELIIPTDTPVIEKEKYWDDMVKKLFDEFNIRMKENIHNHLNIYVKGNDHIAEF